MKARTLLFALTLLLLLPGRGSNAQESIDRFEGNYRKIFTEAESFFLYEDYPDALYLYRILKKEFPNNNKYDYRIGLCYLNMMGRKDQAIPYLKKASSTVTEGCREHLYRENCVPIDVFFYLGDAYRINNELDKAIANYEKFIEISDETVYDTEIVKQEIAACIRAKKSQKSPKTIKFQVFDELANENNDIFNAILSQDGNTLVYASRLQFYTAVFHTTKNSQGEWAPPRNIIPDLAFDDHIYPSSLNEDGTELFLYRLDDYEGNIYRSQFRDGRFQAAEKLPQPVNSRFWEAHASISPDGKTLYFSSNREGGMGGLDIYKTSKQDDGTWTEPVNLGAPINTHLNENTPFITDNESSLFFSSQGHNTIGGYDIFQSTTKNDQNWSTPINLGYPLNTTDDDLFFFPAPKSQEKESGYMSRINPEKGSKRVLYKVTF